MMKAFKTTVLAAAVLLALPAQGRDIAEDTVK